MKLRLPRRRLWRVAIYLGSLWLVITAVDLVLVQVRREIRPGYQTTRILSPTLPDGRIDYLVAVDEHFGHGVTPENNAAIPMVRALGRDSLSPDQPTDGVTDRLGMEPIPEKGEYFAGLHDYYKSRNAQPEPTTEPVLDQATSETGAWPPDIGPFAQDLTATPWPPKFSPITRDWIKANERPLNLIADASRRPRFFIPFYAGNRPDTMVSIYLKHVLPLREACRALMTRAILRLEAGDPAGFHEDMLVVHRWTRLLGQTQTLVERLAATAIETSACRVDRLAAASGRLPAADAKALAEELARLGDLPSPVDTIDAGERYFVLDLCQWMARGGPRNVAVLLDEILNQKPGGVKPWTRAMTTFLPVPYEKAMRSMNAFYDGAVVAWRQPTWATRREAIRLWEAEADRASSRSLVSVFLAGNWPAIYLLPSLSRMLERTEMTRAELRLARVALALAAYKADRGAYPVRLDDLAPAYLPVVPADPFTDTPFVYARVATDGYRLHSVGPNMKDDGGANQKPADDIPAGSARQASATTGPTTR